MMIMQKFVTIFILFFIFACQVPIKKEVPHSLKICLVTHAEDPTAQPFKDSDDTVYYLSSEQCIKNHHLQSARAKNNHGSWHIELDLTGEGSRILENITSNNIRKNLAVLYQNKVLLAPAIYEKIFTRQFLIVGNFTEAEAQEIIETISH